MVIFFSNRKHEMKELSPNHRSEIISFSASVQESLDKDEISTDIGSAEISHSGDYVCIARGSSLELVCLQNGKRTTAYSFDKDGQQWQISCFCPYQDKFLIAISPKDVKNQNHLVCVFNPGTSRVIKAIKIPHKVTSLCLLKEHGGAGDKSNFIRLA